MTPAEKVKVISARLRQRVERRQEIEHEMKGERGRSRQHARRGDRSTINLDSVNIYYYTYELHEVDSGAHLSDRTADYVGATYLPYRRLYEHAHQRDMPPRVFTFDMVNANAAFLPQRKVIQFKTAAELLLQKKMNVRREMNRGARGETLTRRLASGRWLAMILCTKHETQSGAAFGEIMWRNNLIRQGYSVGGSGVKYCTYEEEIERSKSFTLMYPSMVLSANDAR